MTASLDITAKQSKEIATLLSSYLPGVRIWAFGSRVKWSARPESDLDLVAFATPEGKARIAELGEAFEECSLPFRVDLHVWRELPESFRKNIEAEFIVLQEAGPTRGVSDSDMVGEVQLGDVANVIMGQSPPGSTYNEAGEGLPFFQGVRDFNYRHPSVRVFCSVPTRIAQPEDILFSVRAPIGRVNVANIECSIGRGLSIIRSCSRSDSRFIEFVLRGMEQSWQIIEGGGSVFGNTTKRDIETLHIPWPKKPLERETIASILGALDDKIELNRRMNETLEEMVRAIFKSWFVDFDPVRAKAAGQQPHGLKPEIAALFPDAFEDSELGEIPWGWTITSLADQITAKKGLSYKGQYLCEPGEGLPMHNLNSVYEGGSYKNEGLKWYKGEYRPAHLLRPGDVIVTNTEQGFDYLLIGYAAIVPERYGQEGLFSHHIFRIQPEVKSYLPMWFTYLLLRTRRFHDVIAGYSNGTTVNMLPLDGLQKPKFVLPPEEIVEQFGRLFNPTQQRLESIYDENMFLAALRDTLLPKLISGELGVKGAEKFLEKVGV